MGQLIDDMLTLSRITRAEMRHETVNLSAIANDVLEELQKDQPERKVESHVEPKLVAEGDPQLLRVHVDQFTRITPGNTVARRQMQRLS